MKSSYLIFVLLLVFGCKTKAVTGEKTKTKEVEYFVKTFDSLFEKATQARFELYRKQSLISSNLVVTSFPQYDSMGKRKPFHYKHFINGELKEEIYLDGGDINKATSEVQTKINEKKQENKTEKAIGKGDLNQKKITKKATTNKAKKVKVTGFQFGFYAWAFLIIVALIILRWVVKKFKLPDRFKSFLNGG